MTRILVTGPQRSGTTIAAHIISQDKGLHYIDENEFLKDQTIPPDSVVQAPFVLKFSVELSIQYPDLHIIKMVRHKQDIIASMERVNWHPELAPHYDTLIDHFEAVWKISKLHIPEDRYTELPYRSLSTHPLFVKDRSHFTLRQWKP